MARTERTCARTPQLVLTTDEYAHIADVCKALHEAVTTIDPGSILLDVFAAWLWRLELLARI